MAYNPPLRLYYIKPGDAASNNNRLVPAPQIKIDPEFFYANDTIIGYTYNVTISGYASSVDLTKNITKNTILDFNDVLSSIQKIKNIFNCNGGKLLATNQNGQLLFELTGATIRSINFQESDNNWVNYSQYSIELEFNEIRLGDCSGSGVSINCGQIPSGISDSPELLDMKTYKVKSFNDEWIFGLDDNIYNTDGLVRNEHFNISYSISVTGKHYFDNGSLIPSWEQAKNFAEFKLHQQVNRLNTQILRRTGSSTGCATDGSLSSIFRAGPPGLLDGLSDFDYKIYNEKVNCSTSEGGGSFSLEYSAILKRALTSSLFADPATIHTYSTTTDVSDDGSQKNTSISVNGTIQGLLEGGIIKSPTIFSLPANGSVVISVPNDTSTNKYSNAKLTFDLISDGKKLVSDFASALGVTNSSLGVSGECIDPSGVPSKPLSFNATHDYTNGSINYTTQYDSASACKDTSQYQSVTITVAEKTPVIAEFIVPGRAAGPIIQNINTSTPKKITLAITGSNPTYTCCSNESTLVDSSCAGISISGVPAPEISGTILTRNTTELGADGSYSINREYIVCDN
jgi:hypothetical protein